MIDTKHLIGGIVGAILTVAIGLAAQKGIDIQVPCSSGPAAQSSPAAK